MGVPEPGGEAGSSGPSCGLMSIQNLPADRSFLGSSPRRVSAPLRCSTSQVLRHRPQAAAIMTCSLLQSPPNRGIPPKLHVGPQHEFPAPSAPLLPTQTSEEGRSRAEGPKPVLGHSQAHTTSGGSPQGTGSPGRNITEPTPA